MKTWNLCCGIEKKNKKKLKTAFFLYIPEKGLPRVVLDGPILKREVEI